MTSTELWKGFETITAADCRRLLETTDIGRLALTADALPLVLPVQYRVEDPHHLVLRTPAHRELVGGFDGQIIGFEADQLDMTRGTGWCVSVIGPVRALPRVAPPMPLHRWFDTGSLLELRTDMVVGHRTTG